MWEVFDNGRIYILMYYQDLVQNIYIWFCEIDENAFYYFLSTIPQITAAVFALSSAFILRKFNLFDREIQGYLKLAGLVNRLDNDRSEENFDHLHDYVIMTSTIEIPETINPFSNPDSLIPHGTQKIEEVKQKKRSLKKLFSLVAMLFCSSSCLFLFGILTISKQNFSLSFIVVSVGLLTLIAYVSQQWKLIENTFIEYKL